MKCVSPITVYNKVFSKETMRFHKEPAEVPCGQCIACRINKTEEWALRLVHEWMFSDGGMFITMTYRDEPEEYNIGNKKEIRTETVPFSKKTKVKTLRKRHIQLFLKSLRKELSKSNRKIRYFIAGEYGSETHRPHYHGIIFGMKGLPDRTLIQHMWIYGYVEFGDISYQSARYTAKYIQKRLTGDASAEYKILDIEPEFAVMSRRPGIGYNASLNHLAKWIKKGYIIYDGVKRPIPRYYLTHLRKCEKKYMELKKELVQEKQYERMIRELGGKEPTAKDFKKYGLPVDTDEAKTQRKKNLEQKAKLKRKDKL